MQICKTINECHDARDSLSGKVALVPTMGNLHEGHLTLIREAKKQVDHVIVTIFINPLQFGPNEDLENYPRTLEQDIEHLKTLDVDLLFMPSEAVIYPEGMINHTRIDVPNLTDRYCGTNRPGHYIGVATIFLKLFNLTQPDIALFGKKDFQQLIVITKLSRDMGLRINIQGVDTVREDNGLAMSSRNQYLSVDEKAQAIELYQTLEWAKQQVTSDCRDYDALAEMAINRLNTAGFEMEYFAVSDQVNLTPANNETTQFVILAAGRIGLTRLIDNVDFTA